MQTLILPKDYQSKLSLKDTEIAIKKTKDFFECELSKVLNLTRVSAPLFVRPETGLNDNLNGSESAVSHPPVLHGGYWWVLHGWCYWSII